MKKAIILLSALCLLAFFVQAFDARVGLPNPPRLSMIAAYSFAVQALGTYTNKFHCVASKVDRDLLLPAGAWVFILDENAISHKYDE